MKAPHSILAGPGSGGPSVHDARSARRTAARSDRRRPRHSADDARRAAAGDLHVVSAAAWRHPQPVTMFGQMMFMVRATGDPMSLLPAARRVVAEIDPDRPLSSVGTMEQRLGSVVPAARLLRVCDHSVCAHRHAARRDRHLRCAGVLGLTARTRDWHPLCAWGRSCSKS